MAGTGISNYRAVFASGPFRRFWLGYTGSELGDAMTRVALTWHVWETTRSAEALGWLMLCFTGPVVVGGLLAGSLLDRFDRRTVMLVDNVIRGSVMGLVPVLYWLGWLELWHVYVAAGAYGLLMMISLAGGPSLVPSLVRPEHLATANALETLSFTLGGVIGPPLAGVLIGMVGAPNVVLLDALSYAVFALALASVPRAPRPDRAAARAARLELGLGSTLFVLFGHPVLRTTTLMFMTYNIGNGSLLVWLPILADQRLGGGAELYGFLLGAFAAGQIASSLLAGTLPPTVPYGRMICAVQAIAGVAVAGLLVATEVWGVVPALLVFGACSAPMTIWAQTLRMRIIPEGLRGRAFALLRLIMQGGTPIGGAAAGALVPLLGLPALIGLSAALVGVPGLLGGLVRDLRHADTASVVPATLPLVAGAEAAGTATGERAPVS